MNRPIPFDYHYGNEADQYTFYRLPKALFTNERYIHLSDSAKILYGLMLDRMSLSVKNEWFDEQNRVYIFFTLEDVQKYINCKHEKAVKLLSELDTVKGVGLIERVKRGQGKASIIYVRKFSDASETRTSENQKSEESEPADCSEVQSAEEQKSESLALSENQTSEKQKSGTPDFQKSRLQKNRSQDFRKSDRNNTDVNNNNLSDINSIPILSPNPQFFGEDTPEQSERNRTESNPMSEFEKYKEIIRKNIDYPILIERYQYDRDRINELVALILETVCTSRQTIRVAGDDYPAEFVKSKFLELNSSHIEFILDCMKKNTSDVRNIKKYMLAVIFNSSTTIDNYYTGRVSHDMAYLT